MLWSKIERRTALDVLAPFCKEMFTWRLKNCMRQKMEFSYELPAGACMVRGRGPRARANLKVSYQIGQNTRFPEFTVRLVGDRPSTWTTPSLGCSSHGLSGIEVRRPTCLGRSKLTGA